MRRGVRLLVVVGLAGALAGCVGGSERPAGAGGTDATPTTSLTTSAAVSSVATSPAQGCPVTRPTMFEPPPGVDPNELFGASSSYGNGRLWVGGLGDDGVITWSRGEDGSIGYKLGWWREAPGELRITGRRLDAPAPALRASVPDGYGQRGFQASGVSFPTEGCWEVTGQVGAASLTFVTLVQAR